MREDLFNVVKTSGPWVFCPYLDNSLESFPFSSPNETLQWGKHQRSLFKCKPFCRLAFAYLPSRQEVSFVFWDNF